MLHECKNICDLSLKIFVVPGCAARLQHQELHIGLEQRHPPVRAAGLLPVQLRNIYTNLYLHIISISISTIIYRPGLMPNWQRLNPANGPDNVRRAMEIAEREFRIPMVLEPDHFARLANQKYWKIFADSTKNICSPHLDELSGMTYLSYFMKEEDSPGYYSTLNWVKNQIPNFRINNFRVSLSINLPPA